MPDFSTVFASIALSSGFSGLIWFWLRTRLKSSIEHDYNQRLETLKAQLSKDNDLALSEFKHKLEIASMERQVRLSKVFDKTAEVIATNYKNLVALRDAVFTYTLLSEGGPRETADELRKQVSIHWREFQDYFKPHKIYVPKASAKNVEEFCNALTSMMRKFNMAEMSRAEPHVQEKRFNEFAAKMEAIPNLLSSLEDDLQSQLGFQIEKNNQTRT